MKPILYLTKKRTQNIVYWELQGTICRNVELNMFWKHMSMSVISRVIKEDLYNETTH